MSRNWEIASSNYGTLFADEPDVDRLNQANAIWDSDAKGAAEVYHDLAALGSVSAMTELGNCYGWGRGVTADFDKAVARFRQAIGAGSWLATLSYAHFLAKHRCFPDCEAVLEGGVDAEWVPAYFWLAWYRLEQSNSLKTYSEIRPLIEYAAKNGHPAARYFFVRFMMKGKFGIREIPHGFRLATEWFGPDSGKTDA